MVPPPGEDLRRFDRISTRSTGTIAVGERTIEGELTDISMMGACFEMPEATDGIEAGAELKLQSVIAEGADPLEVEAVVARVIGNRLGLKFKERLPVKFARFLRKLSAQAA